MQEALSIEGAGCKKFFFCQGVVVQEALWIEGAGCKNYFFLPGGSGAGGIINWGGRVQISFFLPGGSVAGGIISWGGRVQNHFSDLKFFFDFEFKNTSNLIFPGFKVPYKRFLFKDFKTGLTFWHMWFFNFQNLVRSCNHIGGTPCIWLPKPAQNWFFMS